jgi:hypothetical protein
MKLHRWIALPVMILTLTCSVNAQHDNDTTKSRIETKYQANAPSTQPFGQEAFGKSKETTIRWLGMAGFFINSRGTTMMVDPLLDTFDMPLLIDFLLRQKQFLDLMQY